MGANYTIPKRPLNCFRHFLPESLRGTRKGRTLGKTLNEEALEGTIKQCCLLDFPKKVTARHEAICIDTLIVTGRPTH
jgi:hypothetical protein